MLEGYATTGGLEHLLHPLFRSVMVYYHGGQQGPFTKDKDIEALGRFWVVHVFKSVYESQAAARAAKLIELRTMYVGMTMGERAVDLKCDGLPKVGQQDRI